MYHTIIHHCIATFHTSSDIARHHIFAPHRTYSTSRLIPHHSHIRMNKAQHPTSGTAKRRVAPNSTPHYSTSRHVMCDVVLKYVKCTVMWNDVRCVLCRKCGLMTYCEVCGEMWNVTHCHCIIPPHFTLHHSTSKTISDIPNRTTFHVTPSLLTISHQHRSTLFHFAVPYFKSHHIGLFMHLALHPISDYVPHNATFHVLHAISDHTIYWPHYALHLLHTIAPHFTCRSTSCIIASVHHI